MSENDRRQPLEVRPKPAMTVHCPHCSTGYLLPNHLIGPRGSRVRCPSCQGAFVVVPEGGIDRGDAVRQDAGSAEALEHTLHGVVGAAATAGPAVMEAEPATEASASETRPTAGPAAVAAAVLDALVATLGDALVDARLRGRVLSEHGPAIMDAYAEYRRRVGVGAAPDPFRAALKERCGVDLMPRPEA